MSPTTRFIFGLARPLLRSSISIKSIGHWPEVDWLRGKSGSAARAICAVGDDADHVGNPRSLGRSRLAAGRGLDPLRFVLAQLAHALGRVPSTCAKSVRAQTGRPPSSPVKTVPAAFRWGR